MTFYTSYFGNIKRIREQHPDYILVSISLSEKLSKDTTFSEKRFSPELSVLQEYKRTNNAKKCVEDFNLKLQNLNIDNIIKEIAKKYGANKNYVLLCYEKPTEFCHRHIIANLLEKKYNIEVNELNIDLNNYKRENFKYTNSTMDW